MSAGRDMSAEQIEGKLLAHVNASRTSDLTEAKAADASLITALAYALAVVTAMPDPNPSPWGLRKSSTSDPSTWPPGPPSLR